MILINGLILGAGIAIGHSITLCLGWSLYELCKNSKRDKKRTDIQSSNQPPDN